MTTPAARNQNDTIQFANAFARLESVFRSIADGIVVADHDGNFVLFNPAAERILGIGDMKIAPNQWAKTYGFHLPDGDTECPADQLPLTRAMNGQEVEHEEFIIKNQQLTRPTWISACATPIRESNGNISGGVAVFHDITDRKRTECELERYAEQLESINQMLEMTSRTDDLTGLLGRRAFDQELAINIALAEQNNAPLCLLLLDVDRFKLINDTFGHLAGDAVLKGLADTIESSFSSPSVMARFGGEEFAIILPDTNVKDAIRAAEELRIAIQKKHFPFEQKNLRITSSLGIATWCQGNDVNEMFHRADIALYAAKESGRNCACFYDGENCDLVSSSESAKPPAQITENRRAWTRAKVHQQLQEVQLVIGDVAHRATVFDESAGGMGILVEAAAGFTLGYDLKIIRNDEIIHASIRHMRIFSEGMWHIGIEFDNPQAR